MEKLIAALDDEFKRLHDDSVSLVKAVPFAQFYRPASGTADSCGTHIIRSAAIIEQTFGGITTNLWDDPFEWTQPETLTSNEKVVEYLNEVEATRRRGFQLFASDDDLKKEIMSPSGETQLLPLLLDTLARAAVQLARAQAAIEEQRKELRAKR
jgi:hypothetical protein